MTTPGSTGVPKQQSTLRTKVQDVLGSPRGQAIQKAVGYAAGQSADSQRDLVKSNAEAADRNSGMGRQNPEYGGFKGVL